MTQRLSQWLSAILLGFFILDTWLHFVILPPGTLQWVLVSWKGDIDFTHLGIINLILRLAAYGVLAYKPNLWQPIKWIAALLIVIPTVYLMVDSLWVFSNYVLLYGYWAYSLMLIGVIFGFSFFPKLWKNAQPWLILAALLLILFIGIVYVEIMGFDWPVEFIYSFIQHVIYEALFLVFLVLTVQLKGNYDRP